MMPPFPARKATYDMAKLKDPKQDLFTLYPEAPLCRNCNACTEACPQKIDVREGVWKAVFGDFKGVSEMFMDCVMCGHVHAGLHRGHRAQSGRAVCQPCPRGTFQRKPARLDKRIGEIERASYDR